MKLLISVFFLVIAWSHKLAAQVVESTPVVLTGSIDYQSQIGRVLGVLLLILLLIFAVVWVMKKIGYTGNTVAGPLSIKACLSLSNKEKLYVVQVGEEQLLIGVGANGITPLKNIEKVINDDVSAFSAGVTFSKKLQEIMQAKKADRPQTDINKTEVL